MDQPTKDLHLVVARAHLAQAQTHISQEIGALEARVAGNLQELRGLERESDAEDTQMIQQALLIHARAKAEELKRLLPQPYFTRLDLQFADDAEPQTYYVAKHSFSEESIYSWTTPLASLRYEEPGPVSFQTPEDGVRHGELLRRDQFMIVGNKIIFLATEGKGIPRELIYQEYLSARKTTFALPEIVAQMEKAQDQVIRAPHAGPFSISGPAGSGKTTLALHRIAFLNQSPDTAGLYPSRSIIVFVQDTGTQDYFSHLLPELGITDVAIVTFSQWALDQIGMFDRSFVVRPGSSEAERDAYEYAKLQALHAGSLSGYRRGGEFSLLEKHYASHFSPVQKTLFQSQKAGGQLDRFDLTLLLAAYAKREEGFPYWQESAVRQGSGSFARKMEKRMREYSLVLVDEFQNYLPEQLKLIHLTLAKRRSIVYVGDMAQQTWVGTVRDFAQIGESVSPERAVRLHKVYRNTRQILEYIRGLGYAVEIPEGIKGGPEVQEITAYSTQTEIEHIRALAQAADGGIGVLAKDPEYLAPFKAAFADSPLVRCMSIREAQGVEFETVCLVGMAADTFAISPEERLDADFAQEKQRINRDLLYVALTRAISRLHVLGSTPLTLSK